MPPTDETLSLDDAGPSQRAASVPTLLLVLQADQPAAGSARWSLADLEEVRLGRGPARGAKRLSEEGALRLEITVADGRVSTRHAKLRRITGGWTLVDEGSKNGTRVNGRTLDVAGGSGAEHTLDDGDLIELGHCFFLYRDALPGTLGAPDLAVLPVGDLTATLQPLWEQELARLDASAQAVVPIVLHGESGTGKELLAARAHERSRRPGPLVAVNCAGLTDTLLTAQLFGHRRGAFSGADADAPGLVRASDRGTLFLDEVGDLPANAQAALLRVLQEREVLPVGATRAVPVDLRVVCATHRDLRAAAAEGTFRVDLLARLAGFWLEVPPLRERREDLGLLVGRLLNRPGATLEVAAARALLLHSWPLNVRELGQALASAQALAQGRPIELRDLPAALAEVRAPRRAPDVDDDGPHSKAALEDLLRRHEGNVSAVARELGKARTQVHRWLDRHGLDPQRFRS